MSICLLMLCTTILTVNANDDNNADETLYYKTISYQTADDYVKSMLAIF